MSLIVGSVIVLALAIALGIALAPYILPALGWVAVAILGLAVVSGLAAGLSRVLRVNSSRHMPAIRPTEADTTCDNCGQSVKSTVVRSHETRWLCPSCYEANVPPWQRSPTHHS